MPNQHKTNPIPFRPPAEDRSRLMGIAGKTGRKVNAILREALRDWLDRNETTNEPEGEPK